MPESESEVVGNLYTRIQYSSPRYKRANRYAIPVCNDGISYVPNSQDKHDASYYLSEQSRRKTCQTIQMLMQIYEKSRAEEMKRFSSAETHRIYECIPGTGGMPRENAIEL